MSEAIFCSNCKYNYSEYTCEEKDKYLHCWKCTGFSNFLSKSEEYPKTECSDCKYADRDLQNDSPCKSCNNYSNFNSNKTESPRPREKLIQVESSEPVIIYDDVESSTNQDSPTSETSETGADKMKEMIATAVNNFHFSLDPCKMCKYESDENTCKTCCYYYASEFEPKEMK